MFFKKISAAIYITLELMIQCGMSTSHRIYISILFILFAPFGCATHETPPEQLVTPWDDVLAQGEAPLPFFAKYMRDDKAMVYVAAKHANATNDATFVMVNRALKEFPPQIVLLEGFESDKGESPKEIKQWAMPQGKGGRYEGGESAYAVQLALKAKIPFRGLEPDEAQVRAGLEKAGFTAKEMVHFYFLRQVPQWQRAGTLDFEKIETTYKNFAKDVAQKIKLQEVPSYGEFTRWHKDKNKEPFNLSTIDSEKTAPLISGAYYTQKMSSTVGLVRDRHMMMIIAEEWKKNSRIFVILGGSHWMTQKLALESLGGFPSFEYKPY